MATPDIYWDMFSLYFGHRSLEGFQRFAGLPETGVLDSATVDMLYTPRCGVSDALRATLDARWRKKHLEYCIDSRVLGLSPGTVDDVVRAAFQSWADVADLKFTQVGSVDEADLVISTGRGPRAGFDGPSGTLAWAQLPNGSDQPLLCRFDLDEQWVKDPNLDILLLAVAAHEFGHLLGLDHDAQNSGSLMAPFYKRGLFKPQANDVRRIQAYYGPPTTPPPPPDPTVPGSDAGWITRLYRDLIGRTPSDAEVAAWLPKASNRRLAAREFLASTEYNRHIVRSWYRGLLNREPDLDGLANFVRALDAGMSLKDALAVILASPEYYSRTPRSSIGLDPGPSPAPTPSPPGGTMREVVTIAVSVTLGVGTKYLPGFMATWVMSKQAAIVDFIMKRFGLEMRLNLVNLDGAVQELSAEIGAPPTS